MLASGGVTIVQEQFEEGCPTKKWGALNPDELQKVRSCGDDLWTRLEETGFRIEKAHGTPEAKGRDTIYLAWPAS